MATPLTPMSLRARPRRSISGSGLGSLNTSENLSSTPLKARSKRPTPPRKPHNKENLRQEAKVSTGECTNQRVVQGCVQNVDGEIRSPLTPIPSLVHHMRQRLEQQLVSQALGTSRPGSLLGTPEGAEMGDSRTSPGLCKLRNTPVQPIKARQRVLDRAHRAAQGRVTTETVAVGGGVCYWPAADRQRLTGAEGWTLGAGCGGLAALTGLLFVWMHGTLWQNLHTHTARLHSFMSQHQLSVSDQTGLDTSVLHWHTTLTQHMNDLELTFAVTLGRSTICYQLGVLSYCVAIVTLLYYLGDNVFTKSKLTPRRIKTWVSLLTVTGTWTLMGLGLLASAQKLESTVEQVVRSFNEKLSTLVYTNLSLTTYHNVLSYWSTRCLSTSSPGSLSILGLLAVRDVAYYLQYYSLPVLTAILTPVVKLVLDLKTVYSVKLHPS